MSDILPARSMQQTDAVLRRYRDMMATVFRHRPLKLALPGWERDAPIRPTYRPPPQPREDE